ncbi:beta-lactamase family protein [Olivibacter sp. SA151]|uniref:serine hydrolase domain-containing protein n=1 Tax=Olivibacter jilunii TaxID=985016 RepID=UPI003F181CDF
MKKIVLFLLSLCLLPSANAQKKQVAKELKAIMAKYEAVGLSVAVLKGEKIVYNQSFGFKDLTTKEKIRNHDIFRIASISKSFTATSLMQLVEAGKLSLDDDVSNLIGFKVRNPRFPDRKISLEMILSHRSSLSDKNGYFTLDVLNPDKNAEWEKCYHDYAPGEGYQYCNLNFNLAGTILEKISGQRFDQYVKTHILDPLNLYGGYWVDGLDSTRFVKLYEYDTAGFKLAVDAYAPRRKEIAVYQMGVSTPIFSPTGGMKISARDLALYMGMHMYYGTFKGKQLITAASSRRMQTVLDPSSGYGLALLSTKTVLPGKTLLGHTGSAYGLYSAMFFDPAKKYGFVVITNGCNTTDPDAPDKLRNDCIASLYRYFISDVW